MQYKYELCFLSTTMRILLRSLHFTFLFLLGLHFAVSQDCPWASRLGGDEDECTISIVADGNGFSYSGGAFMSHFFYTQIETLTCSGLNDLFLVKNDPMGNEVWARRFGGTNMTDYESMGSMVMDTLNSRLLITGSFFNTLTLPDTVLSGYELTIFVLAIDYNGQVLWARAAGGNGEDRGLGIACDGQGNIYISGINSKEAFFGTTSVPRGGFLAKFDKNGSLLWAKNKFRFLSTTAFVAEAIPQNIYFFNENLLVNGDALSNPIIIDSIFLTLPMGSNAAFLGSFSTGGDIQWLTAVGSPHGSGGTKVSCDRTGNIYLSGTIWYHMGIFGDDTLHCLNYDCFLAKFSSNGTYQWARGINPSGNALGFSVSTDNEDNVYFTGTFQGWAHFGSFTLFSDAPGWMDADIFLARYNGNGDCIGVNQYSRGTFPTVTADRGNNIFLGGSFIDTLRMGSQPFPSKGEHDAFTGKCAAITGIIHPGKTDANTLLIFANPNTGQCRVTIPEEFRREKELALYVYDHTGRLIQEARLHLAGETVEIDIRARAKGLYHAILSNGEKSYPGKIVFE